MKTARILVPLVIGIVYSVTMLPVRAGDDDDKADEPQMVGGAYATKALQFDSRSGEDDLINRPTMSEEQGDLEPLMSDSRDSDELIEEPPTLPNSMRDPAFERYVDLLLAGRAIVERDASLLTDVALQLAEGERVLLRTHASGLTARRLMGRAAQLASERGDKTSIARLIKAGELLRDEQFVANLRSMETMMAAGRTADSALMVPVETTDVEVFAEYKRWLDAITESVVAGDKFALEEMRGRIEESSLLNDEQKKAILARWERAKAAIGEPDLQDESIKALMAAGRGLKMPKIGGTIGKISESVKKGISCGFTGYQTNKFDLKAEQEAGGWVVAWGDDISETDVAKGLVAVGVSVYVANPAPFYAWVDQLVWRTINSLHASGRERFPEAIRNQVLALAADTIRAAIAQRDAKSVFKRYDTVDFKAGAIRYSGANYVCGQVVSRTWGLKPYVAFRWRGSSR